ncbi:MAG: HIT family protein [Pseudomonadota bacterium]
MISWQEKSSVAQCPFEQPREQIDASLVKIRSLGVSTVYLERIQTYQGHCVLIFDPRHVTRIDQLSKDEWRCLADDIHTTQLALMQVFKPDHVNVASIGQMVPHLHWHVIPRYEDDPRWGSPIWMTTPQEQREHHLPDAQYAQRVALIQAALA